MIEAASAIIRDGNKLLICQPIKEKKKEIFWEFPYGVIGNGESPESCIMRVCHEEFDIELSDIVKYNDLTYSYNDYSIHIQYFDVKLLPGAIKVSKNAQIKWIDYKELKEYNFSPADSKIVEILKLNKWNEDYESDFYDVMSFSSDSCFICGVKLSKENCTEEHIYPRWLQKKFNLSEKEITLLNGSLIKYKKLTVPCCKNCNSIYNTEIEKPMQIAVNGGYDTFIKINDEIIFQWLNKIAYGMLFKELSLKADLKDQNSRFIVTKKIIEKEEMKRIFLQTVIHPTTFWGKPYSVLVFKIKDYENYSYWGFDSYRTNSFFMRMNDIGIIANLHDNGYSQEHFFSKPKLKDLLDRELNIVQFAEVCANEMYASSLLDATPKYQIVKYSDRDEISIISSPLFGYLEKWNNTEYLKYLEAMIETCCLYKIDAEIEDGFILSALFDENNNFVDYSLADMKGSTSQE